MDNNIVTLIGSMASLAAAVSAWYALSMAWRARRKAEAALLEATRVADLSERSLKLMQEHVAKTIAKDEADAAGE